MAGPTPGGGGGGAAPVPPKEPANSGSAAIGTQFAIPWVKTWASRPNRPLRTPATTSSRLIGPCCWPPTATYHALSLIVLPPCKSFCPPQGHDLRLLQELEVVVAHQHQRARAAGQRRTPGEPLDVVRHEAGAGEVVEEGLAHGRPAPPGERIETRDVGGAGRRDEEELNLHPPSRDELALEGQQVTAGSAGPSR